jgi:hypothetical protein
LCITDRPTLLQDEYHLLAEFFIARHQTGEHSMSISPVIA